MASKFTSEQVRKKAEDFGVWDSMSDADKQLIISNPDAGMTIVQGKYDWLNASTQQEKEKAHALVESVRKSYGGYSGGDDGGSFYASEKSPGSFNYAQKPSFEDPYAQKLENERKEYLEREDFSYDAQSDPLYSQYKKTYAREGERATADALGAAAAASGGIPSSYALTAASEAGNYYVSKMADKIPELHDIAYGKYLDELNLDRSDIEVLEDASDTAYNRYLDELRQYNTDRDFEYGQHIDDIEWQEEKSQNELKKAETAAKYGDYSLLGDLLINVNQDEPAGSEMDFDQIFDIATLAAEYGDLSKLNELGIDTSKYEKMLAEQKKEQQMSDNIIEDIYLRNGRSYVLSREDWKYFADMYGEKMLKAAGFERAPRVAGTD